MFDPVEADLYRHYLWQDEDEQDEQKIEEAVWVFLNECLESEEFCKFVDKGFLSLDEMKKVLFDTAQIEDGEVKFWVGDTVEYISTMIEDYGND